MKVKILEIIIKIKQEKRHIYSNACFSSDSTNKI